LKDFIEHHKVEIAVIAIFIVMLTIFVVLSPDVFLKYRIYIALFTTLPILVIITTSLVFVIASGEIDLSFPSVIGVSAFIFAVSVKNGINPLLALIFAVTAASFCGFINGFLVANLELSSLIATLGMNFILRGLITIITDGLGIPLAFLRNTFFYQMFVGTIGKFPIQIFWMFGFIAFTWFLFYRHRFGAHVCFVGDNLTGSREMGIDVRKTKILSFVVVGGCTGFAGVLLCLINNQFWPTTGSGYLLMALAAVFIGGNPTWGGVGTIFGAIIGSCILGFMESGIIAAGLTGFYTQFFFGLILILALMSHKFSGLRKQ
jgi:simple sugar transport system permease protein